ncbi:DUF5107 domain-containing protein [Pedobacter sp. MC2016-14]|uniref:DUF5107 domain-containing protein n=1 Tax=Pedobacter sp. MC2016-14 TaxID=2897327 RepID=UPI001E2858FA|nr:DUF5107 domain-containing protein [Pedobacter sp. MC2016-14]MCD0486678.1 DUF5107 domain-containing protein [Pedobacter sp. MC2016-14]
MEQGSTCNGKAQIRTEQIVLCTYPYSDPNPVPEFGRLYPYNRFDGYTDHPQDLAWEMVVMENDFIKLWINPSIGGKIWGAIEKATGKEFIYFNHTAKFRDVAMRGPWTSGGMETNMGIIGHTPSCSAPIDYHLRHNEDGSVSCFIGATDWPSRTEWRIEVHLDKNAAYFSTKSWWYNNSCLSQSYYQWNNVGIKTAGNLEYVFPGHKHIGHNGTALNWPEDENGKHISQYEQNDVGEYKSYHVFGSFSDFWGCYWHNDQFGMGHAAAYDDKPGKKIWIWGLSRYGMIWEDLLTDSDGQYTEVQSGRLFNQSIAASSKTPFKHRSFLPCTFDTWEEHWFPVKNTGGLSYGNQQLSFHITAAEQGSQLNICANTQLNHLLKVFINGQEVLNASLQLKPMDTCSFAIAGKPKLEEMLVLLNDTIIFDGPEQHSPLSRPIKIDEGYDFNAVQASCLQAKEWERQRFYKRAIDEYAICLKKDPYFIEALCGLAGLCIKRSVPEEALPYLLRALATDTYHDEANYLYGLANVRLNQLTDAKDGFSIASQSVAYRTAAYTELSKMYFREGQLEKANTYLKKAQLYSPLNLQCDRLNIVINRLKGNTDLAQELCRLVLKKDPLNYLARFELDNSTLLTVSEMPHETYLELAAFYYNLNLYAEAVRVLVAAPAHAIVQLWIAYLQYRSELPELAALSLEKSALLTAELVFPHREEDLIMLKWAIEHHPSWKFRYYLALHYVQNLRKNEALGLLKSCGQLPDFYPFYLVRAKLEKELNGQMDKDDLQAAYRIAPEEWRTVSAWAKYLEEQGDYAAAVQSIEKCYATQPENYYLGLQLARCLMQMKAYKKGITLMKGLNVLPNEGASEGRNCWRETHLYAALEAMETEDWNTAVLHIEQAKTWPEQMGIGKPYHVDERLEDFMMMSCYAPQQHKSTSALLHQIACYREAQHPGPYGSTDFISFLVLMAAGETEKAQQLLSAWVQQDPEALPLAWSLAVVAGDQKKIDQLSGLPLLIKEVLPYEIPFEDRSYLFIKKLYKMGFLNLQATVNQ